MNSPNVVAKGCDTLPNIERDELISLMMKGICEQLLTVAVEEDIPGESYCPAGLLEFSGCADVPVPNVYLCIEREHHVPITFLIDVMRSARIPLVTNEGWLIWNSGNKCLASAPDSAEDDWYRACARQPTSLSEENNQIFQFLRRSALTTDHGKKPLLLERNFLPDALTCREVEFADLLPISHDAINDYVVAFYDSLGKPRALPLAQVAALGLPVFTRSGVFGVSKSGLTPYFNDAHLLAGAFFLAVRHNPNEFLWFQHRERGSIFHSAIDRIDAPRIPFAKPTTMFNLDGIADPHRYRFVAEGGNEAISNAEQIVEMSDAFGRVLLTAGGHPLDAALVTTPELYMYAISTIIRHGYTVSYGEHQGVKLKVSAT